MSFEQNNLSDSASLFQNFFNISSDLLCSADLGGQIIHANLSFHNFFGTTPTKSGSHNLLDLLGLQHLKDSHQAKADFLRRAQVSELCLRIPSQTGTLSTIIWNFALDATGQALLAIGRDLTEMTQTRRRLEDAQRIAQIGSFEFEVASGKMTWSQEMYKIFPDVGDRTQLGLSELQKRVHEDDRANFIAAHEQALRTGAPFKILFKTSYEFDQKWVEVICNPKVDPNGQVTALIGTYQNVTDRILNESEHRLVIDALNIGVWKYNCVTRSLTWDQSMYRLYGIDERSFSGHYDAWAASLTKETRQAAEQAMKDALAGIKDFDTTFEIELPNQVRRSIGARAKIIRDGNGQPLWMFGVNWDRSNEAKLAESVEESRASAQQNSKLALLGEMAAGIAHEINNPLTIISGKAEVLMRKALDAKLDNEYAAKSAELILKTAQRLAKIVKGLRTFSRNSDHDAKQICEVSAIVADCLELCQEKLRNNGVEVVVNVPGNIKILANPTQICQVLMNLISNAFDAISAHEKPWVQIEASQVEGKVRLSVTDSGTGIPPEIAAKIMTPFFTTKKAGYGTGIGLSIITNIAKDHNAHFFYDNSNTHTSFVIDFPQIEETKRTKDCQESGARGAA